MAVDYPTVNDRNVATPSRVELAATSGATGSGVYDVTPVTGAVVEEGTPINNSLFQAIKEYIDDGDSSGGFNNPAPATTSGTGAAYTVTIPEWEGVESLDDIAGIPFTIFPHVQSTSAGATLSVNGLPASRLGLTNIWGTGAYATTPTFIFGNGVPVVCVYSRVGSFLVLSVSGIPHGGSYVQYPWSASVLPTATASTSGIAPKPVVAESTDGVAYTCTIEEWKDVTSLSDIIGIPFSIIAQTTSASASATLSVNGLQASTLKPQANTTIGVASFSLNNWFVANRVIEVMFDGGFFRVLSTEAVPNGGNSVSYPWSGAAIQNTYMLQGRTLISSVNFNSYASVGNYFFTNATARSATNAPPGLYYGGTLTVAEVTGQYFLQEIRDLYGTIWVRLSVDNGATWTRWMNKGTTASSALLGPSFDATDANDIISPGYYSCEGLLPNIPIVSVGTLTIQELSFAEAGTNSVLQQFRPINTTDIYERYTTNGGTSWSAWQARPSAQDFAALEDRIANAERRISDLELGDATITTMVIDTLETGINSFAFALSDSGDYSIDWGDGGAEQSTGGTITHDYANGGVYTIRLQANNTTELSVYPAGTTTAPNLVSIKLDENITSFSNQCFRGTRITAIEIPDSITRIPTQCFYSAQRLEQIIMPNTVTSISAGAFANCRSLVELDIPESVKTIDSTQENYGCFYNCTALKEIVIPNSVTSYGSPYGSGYTTGLFSGCSALESVTLSENASIVWSDMFYGCSSLKTIQIPDAVTSLGSEMFYGCSSLETITGMNGVTDIRERCFLGCSSLKAFTVPSAVTTIGAGAFSQSALIEITIPATVTSFGEAAAGSRGVFQYCTGLTSVNFEGTLGDIGSNCFNGCTALERFTIPQATNRILYATFYGCTKLNKLTLLSETPPTLIDSAFTNVPFGDGIYVPSGTSEEYQTADVWATYAQYIKEEPVV